MALLQPLLPMLSVFSEHPQQNYQVLCFFLSSFSFLSAHPKLSLDHSHSWVDSISQEHIGQGKQGEACLTFRL